MSLIAAQLFVGLASAEVKVVKPDLAPAKAVLSDSEYTELLDLRKKFEDEVSMNVSEEQKLYQLTLKAVSDIEKRDGYDPNKGNKHNWPWGLYLIAVSSFSYGSTLYDLKREPEALAVLDIGLAATEKCVGVKTDDKSFDPMPCRFSRGSLTGKIASINGILSSLSKGKKVREDWQATADGKVDMQLSKSFSLIASANHALGLFNRLIPDLWLVNMIFSIRGNLDESLRRHQLATKTDKNACALYGESTILLCRGQKKNSTEDLNLGKQVAQRAITAGGESTNLKRCVQWVKKVQSDTKLACGFSGAKQVDENEANNIGK